MSRSTSEAGEGREALAVIHISVPRAVKARWVKASQARGMKLTDWIVEQLERPMKTYPIPDAIASQYRGADYALAASAGGQLVALRYLADLCCLSYQSPFQMPSGRIWASASSCASARLALPSVGSQ